MKAQRWYERREDGRYAIYDAPRPEDATSVSIVHELAYYRWAFNLQPCWEGEMTMQIQLRKYKGQPILFFINHNDRGWWLECYDRFGHSEAAVSFRDEHTTSATYDEEANRFALEWARSEPGVEIEVVENLTPPNLPCIGN